MACVRGVVGLLGALVLAAGPAAAQGAAMTPAAELKWSRLFTLVWGIVLIGGAMLFTDNKNPVVEIGLKIASVTYGGLLGTFFLGLLFPATRSIDAVIGVTAGLLTMVAVLLFSRIDFTWHTLIGCGVTMAVGLSVSAPVMLAFMPSAVTHS